MSAILSIILGVAMALVLLVLLTGVLGFAKGGPWYQRNSTRLMNLRVATQLVAVLVLAALVLLSG